MGRRRTAAPLGASEAPR
ncbi:mCG19183, isoform CRA_b [Mus musculus]|nr:mCG19183, isoform CRA_b [Mus musculus]